MLNFGEARNYVTRPRALPRPSGSFGDDIRASNDGFCVIKSEIWVPDPRLDAPLPRGRCGTTRLLLRGGRRGVRASVGSRSPVCSYYQWQSMEPGLPMPRHPCLLVPPEGCVKEHVPTRASTHRHVNAPSMYPSNVYASCSQTRARLCNLCIAAPTRRHPLRQDTLQMALPPLAADEGS